LREPLGEVEAASFFSSLLDAAGRAGAKIGGVAGGGAAKEVFSKEVLKATQRLARKIGVKVLQRTIVRFVVPVVSMGIGTGWNYAATRSVGKIAVRQFKRRLADLEDETEIA
jgi:uncharacterized protein (DUF697 family)